MTIREEIRAMFAQAFAADPVLGTAQILKPFELERAAADQDRAEVCLVVIVSAEQKICDDFGQCELEIVIGTQLYEDPEKTRLDEFQQAVEAQLADPAAFRSARLTVDGIEYLAADPPDAEENYNIVSLKRNLFDTFN